MAFISINVGLENLMVLLTTITFLFFRNDIFSRMYQQKIKELKGKLEELQNSKKIVFFININELQ